MNGRVARERSLAVKHPELLVELHPTNNGELYPSALGSRLRTESLVAMPNLRPRLAG
jgi:hypothetical protein